MRGIIDLTFVSCLILVEDEFADEFNLVLATEEYEVVKKVEGEGDANG